MQTKTIRSMGSFFMDLVFLYLAMVLGCFISGGDFFFIKLALALASVFLLLSVICAGIVVKRRHL